MPADDAPSREDLCLQYLDGLPFEPYPVQEEALLAYFEHDPGVLVCAPTGTGKTLVAEAALYEALHTGKTAYYTTPLIALTEQKFQEVQDAAERWGFPRDSVGLVTGNRSVNPDATVLVVVAEILVNRLLDGEKFDWENVSAVVMDEFHSFADPERGIVWELALALLPKHVRLMLLSATVGNAADFVEWLSKSHGRSIRLVQGTERKVPLQFHWTDDELLPDLAESMADNDDPGSDNPHRRTPALIFCFNRDECWSVAETLKGRHLISSELRKELAEALEEYDFTTGAGPKLKPILLRGVGVHHAGVLPKYKRAVEELFQRRLLSVVVCTETLAAGMNLPARSVVLTTLLKGPPGKKKVADASGAHQMFGRAGRPQYDDQGHVYALAHEDDVKIARWDAKHDLAALERSKDPNVLKAAKRLKKKRPSRNPKTQYWNDEQFQKLIAAPPGKLASKGRLPWRLLAYLLNKNPDVEAVRAFVRKRLMDEGRVEGQLKELDRMLLTLHHGGFVDLEPEPPARETPKPAKVEEEVEPEPEPEPEPAGGMLGGLLSEALEEAREEADEPAKKDTPLAKARRKEAGEPEPDDEPAKYSPARAVPTERAEQLTAFRTVNPVFGSWLLTILGKAEREEWLQIFESTLEFPASTARSVRVPQPEFMPPGPLATEYVDQELIDRGVLSPDELYPPPLEEDDNRLANDWERKWAPALAEKVDLLFRHEFPHVDDQRIRAVWCAGDLLNHGANFDDYVTARGLQKQEGCVFRHCLRLVLLCGEFARLTPDGLDPSAWRAELKDVARQLTLACRAVDPQTTETELETLTHGGAEGDDDFGLGLFE
ncbi:DEAD/DEAH box helicase [Alienimonas sp. DA493]|uniref:DEAD/DEAH box helicase n=1 Tax=Alienimonas sp. DA493 TaxID=3373605 RepID=UPI003754F95F